MRKIICIALLAVSVAAGTALLNLNGLLFADRYEDRLLTTAEYEQRISPVAAKQEPEAVPALFFDGQELFYDETERTFYYSLVKDSASAYNPRVTVRNNGKEVNVFFCGLNISDALIAENTAVMFAVQEEDGFHEYKLKCTTLPLISVNTDESAAIDRTDVDMDIRVFDNGKGTVNRMRTAVGTIHVRGGVTSHLAKTSFRIKLHTFSVGENERIFSTSLLGMPENNEWILYSPYNDQEKIRNVFSTELWRESCLDNNQLHIPTGIEYRYCELFLNGSYWGLYALGYPIDSRLLKLDKESKDQALYKKVYWDEEGGYLWSDYGTVSGYEVKGGKNGLEDPYAWDLLHDYWYAFNQNKNDNAMLRQGIDPANAIDNYLFILMIQGVDNAGEAGIKNFYLPVYRENNNLRSLYVPWDLDLTWGNTYDSDGQSNFVGAYDVPASEHILMNYGHLAHMLYNGDETLLRQMQLRYWELRSGAWSDEAIMALLDHYEVQVYDSGAYERERLRWPDGCYQDNGSAKLQIFKEFCMQRMAYMDYLFAEGEDHFAELIHEKTRVTAFNPDLESINDLSAYLFWMDLKPYTVLIDLNTADEEMVHAVSEGLRNYTFFDQSDIPIDQPAEVYLRNCDMAIIILDSANQKASIYTDAYVNGAELIADIGVFYIYKAETGAYGIYYNGEAAAVNDPDDPNGSYSAAVAVYSDQGELMDSRTYN